jgi:hypothetical protein
MPIMKMSKVRSIFPFSSPIATKKMFFNILMKNENNFTYRVGGKNNINSRLIRLFDFFKSTKTSKQPK